MTSPLKSFAAVAALSILSLGTAPAYAGTIGVDLFANGALVGSQTAEASPDGPVPINFGATDTGYAIAGSALADIDPFFTFGFTISTFGDASQTFGFLFLSPYAAGPYDTLLTEFSSSVSDFGQNGTAMVTPTDASGFFLIPQIDGVDVATGALGGGCNVSGSLGFANVDCHPFQSVSTSVVTLANGIYGVAAAFTISGGDSLTVNGRIELTNTPAVPEPVSVLLIGLGIGATAVRRRFSN